MVAAKYVLSLIEGTVEGKFEKTKYTLKDLAMDEIIDEIGVKDADVYAISYFRPPRVMGRPSIGFVAILKATKEDLKASREGKIELIKVAERIESLDDLKKIDERKLLEAASRGTPTLKRVTIAFLKRIGKLSPRNQRFSVSLPWAPQGPPP